MGDEKGGPPKGPAFMMLARFRAYLLPYYRTTLLPNDPASQQTTGHQQGSRTQRQQRGTARGGKRATRSSRCGATAAAAARRSGAAATATRRSRAAATTTGRSGHGHRRSGAAATDVDVPTGSDALEARAHLVLVDAQILRDTGEILLVVAVVLSGGSGLDLVAVHVLDAATHGVGAACGRAGRSAG